MANGSFQGKLLSAYKTKPVSLTHRRRGVWVARAATKSSGKFRFFNYSNSFASGDPRRREATAAGLVRITLFAFGASSSFRLNARRVI
jgi:hypothetical protein